jgi:hypothetical protein
MPLEDPNSVDIITKSKDGWLELVITDSGQAGSPTSRQKMLDAKFATYAKYMSTPEFLTEHQLQNLSTVRIRVIHSGPAYPAPPQNISVSTAVPCKVPVVYLEMPF